MFSCLVAPTGEIVRSGAYRGTVGSELLEQELLKRLATAKFVPAVHNHQPVIAIFYGTVKFAVVNGKPRLRIFANQQLNEVDKETDYIDPQPYVGQDSKFTGLHYPDTGSSVAVTGVVELALNVDAKGNLKDIQVYLRNRRFWVSEMRRVRISMARDSSRPSATVSQSNPM